MRLLIHTLLSILAGIAAIAAPTATARDQLSLPYFLDAARHNNPAGRLDSLQTIAARLTLEQEKAALTAPQIYAEGGFLAAPVLATGAGSTRFIFNPSKNTTGYQGYDLSLTNGGLYRGVINLEQPLLTGPRLKVLEDEQNLETARLDLHRRVTVHQLEKLVTDQYLLCQYTIRQQAVTRQLLDLVRDQTQVTETLARNALLYQADVQLLKIEASRLATNLDVLEAAHRSQLLDLYTLCGMRDTSSITLETADLHLSEDGSPASAFTEQYRLDSLQLRTSQALFNLRYKPQLNVFTSAGLNTAYAPDIPQRFGWQAGLRFTQVIFDGHQRQTSDKRIEILSTITALQTNFFQDQNAVRKTRIREQLKALDEQDSATRRQALGYDSLLTLYRAQVMAGQLSVINYLTVLGSRAELQQDMAAIAYHRELLVNEYNYWNW